MRRACRFRETSSPLLSKVIKTVRLNFQGVFTWVVTWEKQGFQGLGFRFRC